MGGNTAPGDPVNSTALIDALARVQELLKRGHSQAAVEQCRLLLKDYPDSVDLLRCGGLACLRQERLTEAEQYLLRARRLAPHSPHVLNELGILRLRQSAYKDAIDLFAAALAVDPKHSDALNNIAATYAAQQQPRQAAPYLDRLTQVLPFSAPAHTRAADNSLALNDVEQAIRRGRRAIGLAPEASPARLALAEALEAGGRFKQAKFQYLSVLAREPAHAGALSKLLALRGTVISEDRAYRAERLLERSSLKDEERVALRLGLARYWDHRHEYDRAFEHLHAANGIMFRHRPFDSALQTAAVDRLIGVFSAGFFEALPRHEAPSARPVFIVGMPRSGTTLVEQILASHPRIAAGGELSTIISIAMQMGRSGKSYPEGMRDLDGAALARMAGEYLDKLSSVSATADRVTDKMPFNFMHLGLIRALFPSARIIHCQRDALDTCVSCFFTTFTESLQFASDLTVLGRYFLDYQRLVEHWKAVLPVPWHDLHYEDLVRDTEGTVRRLLGFCDVEWDPNCLRFYRTDRGVRTPSRWQVRQPIYSNSIGRWRRYERHLQPLRDILRPS